MSGIPNDRASKNNCTAAACTSNCAMICSNTCQANSQSYCQACGASCQGTNGALNNGVSSQ
jgi:hypothetical protein